MIPIWAKVDGKWEPFPTYLVETLGDGTVGFRFQANRCEYERTAAFKKFREKFEWNPITRSAQMYPSWEYRLRKQ